MVLIQSVEVIKNKIKQLEVPDKTLVLSPGCVRTKHCDINFYWNFFWYIYWLCYYSCLIFPPSFYSILHTHSWPPPPHSSCPWVMYISSSASTFPTLFLPSPCLFCYAVVSPVLILLPPRSTVQLCLHVHPPSTIPTMFPSQGQLIDTCNSICNFNFPLPCYKHIPGFRILDTNIFLRVALFCLHPL